MEFDQYIGFLIFLVIATAGFWLLIFLTALLPYWIGGTLLERFKMKKEEEKKEEEARIANS